MVHKAKDKKYDDDPDETEGRKLYRERADALANAQLAMAKRKFKLRTHGQSEP
jgi:hypothetical protein